MRTLLVALTTFSAILVSAAPVHAVSFNFSFTNDPILGNVAGTVTGRIDGLADTGTSAATAVFITSIPEQPFGMPFYPLSASDNILAQPSLFTLSNSFTVTGGVLTAADFNAGFPIANTAPEEIFFSCCVLIPVLSSLRTGLVNPLPILKSSLYRPLSSQFQKSHFPPHFQSSPLALARWVCFIGGGNGRARRDVALTFGRLSFLS